jgi:S1-C subfamily serine protease
MRTRFPIAFLVMVVAGFVVPVLRADDAPRRDLRPYLGITAAPSSPGTERPGVRVEAVTPDSPAATAGLQKGDLITQADDQPIKDFAALSSAVAAHKPNDKFRLHLVRAGKEETLTVTLGQRQAERPATLPDAPRAAFLGVHTQELTPELAQQLGVGAEKGNLVTRVMPESPAAKAGLKQEDVITQIGDRKVATPRELREAIRQAEPGKEVRLKVLRGKENLELKAQLIEEPTFPGAFPDLQQFPRVPGGPMVPRLPGVGESQRRIEELERRVKELEKRVQELEQKLNKPAK